jgi:hypothetical protein
MSEVKNSTSMEREREGGGREGERQRVRVCMYELGLLTDRQISHVTKHNIMICIICRQVQTSAM